MDGSKRTRADLYKKKESSFNTEKKIRIIEKSVEWKKSRDQSLNKRRGNIGEPLTPSLTPVKEVNCKDRSKNDKADKRLEQLRKWKLEKELKKKLEAQERAKKKPFKVTHVETSNLPFGPVAKTSVKLEAKLKKGTAVSTTKTRVTENVKLPIKKSIMPNSRAVKMSVKTIASVETNKSDTTRKTRSQSAKANDLMQTSKQYESRGKKFNQKDHRQSTKQSQSGPSKAKEFKNQVVQYKETNNTNIRAASKIIPATRSNAQSPVSANKLKDHSVVKERKKIMDSVNKKRGSKYSDSTDCSFAPHGYKFTAPSNLKSFVFQPLTPNSAASFLNPNTTVTLASPITRRCSTPKLISNNPSKIQQSPQASVIGEHLSGIGSSDSEQEKISPLEVTPKAIEDVKDSGGKSRKSLNRPMNPKKQDLKKDHSSSKNREKIEYKRKPSLKSTSMTEEILVEYKKINDENLEPEKAFLTPSQSAPSRKRSRSLGTSVLLKNSAKKFRTPKNNRSSLILRTLSPEDGIEVLKHSPMIELTRRSIKPNISSKSGQSIVEPLPTFDDIEEELNNSFICTTLSKSQADDISEKSSPKVTGKEITNDQCLDNNKSNNEEKCIPKKDSTDLSSNVATGVDVSHFKQLMQTEIEVINVLCEKWENINNSSPDLSEEACGHIRTAVGKGQLLIAERFKKQFTKLIGDCEYKRGFKETTCEDLQGFWEMVYFQVEDVYNMFKDLDKRQANNWQNEDLALKETLAKKKIVKKKPAAKKAVAKSGFAAFRAKMKQQKEEAKSMESKTFEGGFFHIDSPVKTLTPKSLKKDSVKRKLSANSSESESTPAKISKMDTPPARTSSVKKKSSLRRSTRKSLSKKSETSSIDTERSVEISGSLSKFLVPSMPDSESLMDVDVLSPPDIEMAAQSKRALKDEFDKHSTSTKKAQKTPRQQLRKKQSVHFAVSPESVAEDIASEKPPVTPFNKDSLVARTRRSSRRSTSTSDSANVHEDATPKASDTPSAKMARLKMADNTPTHTPARRSTRRISGFTPPVRTMLNHPSPVLENEDLIAFSPLNNGKEQGFTPRRSRRLTRQSLLQM